MKNYAADKHTDVRQWREANPRFKIHFPHASWMNVVEVWFGIAERQAIRRGIFKSVKGFNTKIRAFIDPWRRPLTPLGLTKTAEQILAKSQPSNSFEFAPLVVYVVEFSAALLIAAASVSTYRSVSDRVSSQPIADSGPDTVRARVSRLPSGCGSTTCAAVTVTPGEFDSQVYDDPSASLVTVHTAVGSRGCCNRVREPTASGPASRRSTASTVGIRSGQRSTSTTTAQTRSGGAAMVTVCCRPGMR